MKMMKILLINETKSEEIKQTIFDCFKDRDVEFVEPLTKGFLKFEAIQDFNTIFENIESSDFTHILISGISTLCVFAAVAAMYKNREINLLIYDMERKKHVEVNISEVDLEKHILRYFVEVDDCNCGEGAGCSNANCSGY